MLSIILTGREEGVLVLAALDLDRLSELKGFFKSPVRVSAADLLRRNCCGLFPVINTTTINKQIVMNTPTNYLTTIIE